MSAGEQPLYLVATDDGSDNSYAPARAAGVDQAERDGAQVVLYDRTSESSMTDPYPVGPWSDEEDAVSASSRLDAETLDSLGRGYLAEQLREAQQRGIEIEAHLGQGSGVEALQRTVERYQPDLVILPASVRESSLLDKVQHNTWEDFADSIDAEIRLIDKDGQTV
ncbi:MAG: universal stress protein [Egibacteraceae bacterium]